LHNYGWGEGKNQLMESETTESSRARDAKKTAGKRCSSNSRTIACVKFEKLYKKYRVFYYTISEDSGKRVAQKFSARGPLLA
jgi:hypothetical protein